MQLPGVNDLKPPAFRLAAGALPAQKHCRSSRLPALGRGCLGSGPCTARRLKVPRASYICRCPGTIPACQWPYDKYNDPRSERTRALVPESTWSLSVRINDLPNLGWV